MSWKDELLPASFRGAPFLVRAASATTGRKSILHEYPNPDNAADRNFPYVEDMGKETSHFRIDAYVIQSPANNYNYIPDRNELIFQLEQPGPGQLNHPTYGTRTVSVVGQVPIDEDFTYRAGEAVFHIEFVEVQDTVTQPSSVTDHAAEVSTVIRDISDTEQLSLESDLDLNCPDYIRESVEDDVIAALNMIRSVTQTLPRTFDGVETSDLSAQIDGQILIASATILSSADLYSMMAGFVGQLSDLTPVVDRPVPANVTAALMLSYFGDETSSSPGARYGGTLSSIPDTTGSRAQQQTNREVIVNLVRDLALGQAALASIEQEFDSYDDMVGARDLFVARVDAQLSRVTDEQYERLRSLQAKMLAGFKDLGASLSHYVIYEVPAGVLPAIVLAYDWYENLDKEDQIIQHNIGLVDHPGFLPSGQLLELLDE